MGSQLEVKQPTPLLVGAFDVLSGDRGESNSIPQKYSTSNQEKTSTGSFILAIPFARLFWG